MQELQTNGVEIYQFPVDDESVSDVNASMNSHVPFAVVGSTEFVKIGNKTVRARQYPWGTVQGNVMEIQIRRTWRLCYVVVAIEFRSKYYNILYNHRCPVSGYPAEDVSQYMLYNCEASFIISELVAEFLGSEVFKYGALN